MPTLSSCVSGFSDLNVRIQLTLMHTNLSIQSIDFNIIKQVSDFLRANELDNALDDFFVSRNETALQVTFAKSLVEELFNTWLPTLKYVNTNFSDLQDRKTSLQNSKEALKQAGVKDVNSLLTDDSGNPIPMFDFQCIDENINTLNSWFYFLETQNRRIIHQIRKFAPPVYDRYIDDFRKYISIREYTIFTVDNQELKPIETGQQLPLATKLKWKGDKTDLAELVWALAKSGRITDTSTSQSVTQKELVNLVVKMFGLDSLDVANLMKGRYGTKTKSSTFKAQDGKNFINTLRTLLDERIID